MRIMVLTDRYPPFYEGAYELMCQQICDGLQARGHSIDVLTSVYGVNKPTVDGNIRRKLHFQGALPHNKLRRRLTHIQMFLSGVQNYWITRRLTTEIHPELAFIWHLGTTSILPAFAVQDLGIHTVYKFGSHWLIPLRNDHVKERNQLKRLYRSAVIGFRRFETLDIKSAIFVGQSLEQSYCQAGFRIDRAVVIPNGIPDTWIANQLPERPDQAIRMLCVGRLEAIKGTDVVVKAIAYLVNTMGCRYVHLDLIGHGQPAYIDMLRHLIADNRLQDVISVVGFVPREELMQRYSSYHILLFATPQWEGMPVSILEAMAHGLVVIASDIGGPRDIIEHGRNGMLVMPSDPQAMAEAIMQVIQSPDLMASLGQEAIRTIHEKHTFTRMINAYESFLEVACCEPLKHVNELRPIQHGQG